MPDKEWIKNTCRRQKREIHLPMTALDGAFIIVQLLLKESGREPPPAKCKTVRLNTGSGHVWSLVTAHSGPIPAISQFLPCP